MDFFLRPGVKFTESFDFKNESGKLIRVPSGKYRLLLVRGDFGREYTVGKGLTINRNSIVWTISPRESVDFEYTTMYYTLYMNDIELARGILRIQ